MCLSVGNDIQCGVTDRTDNNFKERKDMKKYIIAALAAALVLGVGAGTSYAYLTGRDDVENTFQASKTEIEMEEEFDPVPEVLPGLVITKAPKAVSRSSTDCYVRMMVRFSDNAAEAFCEPLSINSGWGWKEDGYYYWHDKVKPGESTGTIFDTVKIRSDVRKENLVDFDILVYAEAVACGDLSMAQAWAAMDSVTAGDEADGGSLDEES